MTTFIHTNTLIHQTKTQFLCFVFVCVFEFVLCQFNSDSLSTCLLGKDRNRERETDRQTDRHTNKQTNKQTDKQTLNKQTKQTKQTNKKYSN